MIENLIEMVLKLSEEVGHLRKDNEILKLKMKTFSATERPSVACVEDSLAGREVTSSEAPRNNAVKTYKDALSAGCVSLPRNPQLSADFVSDRNVVNQAFPVAVTLKNGSSVAIAADDGFTIIKRMKTKKETSSTYSQSLKKKTAYD
jgi:hypothetical protein